MDDKVMNLKPKSKSERDIEIISKLSPAGVVRKMHLQRQQMGVAKKFLARRSLGLYSKPTMMPSSLKKKVVVSKNTNFRNQRFSIDNKQKEPLPPNNKLVSASKPTAEIPTSVKIQQLQQSETASRLNFSKRKSISQMDIKMAKRTGNLALPKTPIRFIEIDNCAAMIRNKNSGALVVASKKAPMDRKLYGRDDHFYIVEDFDQKLSGMRIYATIMLNAWRKRREEVKRLSQEIESAKRGAMKTKTQLHVFNSLFRVEQKRCDELNVQLKWSMSEINKFKETFENLNSAIKILKADKRALEENIQFKDLETENLNALLTQTKSNLFKSMANQRDLQFNVSEEQRKVQLLEHEKEDLKKEVDETYKMFKNLDDQRNIELALKQAELEAANEQITNLLILKEELIEKNALIEELSIAEAKHKLQIESLRSHISLLQQCLGATLGNRIKACWTSSMAYRRTTFQMLHWFAYYMLPATPTPRYDFPFGLSLQKALSFANR